MSDYKTVSRSGCDEFVEKRSRFIGYCSPVTTQEQALEFIEKIKSKHWDAKHNVYAYILREGGIKRYSDDGEPQGTAGVPVLDVMQKMNITDAVVVVTRYFGGILLGAGGLVRAYSHGAKLAVEAAKPAVMELCDNSELKCSYNQYGRVSTIIAQQGGVVADSVFTDEVELKFYVKKGSLDRINKELAAATCGEVEAHSQSESYYMKEIKD